MIVGMGFVMSVIVMMVMAVTVIVVVMRGVGAQVRAALAGVARHGLEHEPDVRFQFLESGRLLSGALIHVELAIHLNLQAVALRRGVGEIRLYTHLTMHENIALYPRLGYQETGRGEQAGFQRVFFRKRLQRGS